MNLNLKVSEAQQKNNIVVFFLSSDEKKGDSYLSLSEGLEKKLVTVNEVDKKEFFLNVLNLKVTNNSLQNLILISGELITGYKIKQHRVVATTTIIPSQSSAIVGVNCCEKSRWSPLQDNTISTSNSLFFSRQNLGRQYKIWNEIKDLSNNLKVKTFTYSAEDIYKKKEQSLKEIENFFKPSPEDIGVVVATNNQIKTLDVFSNNHMLQIYLKKIIRSVAINNFKKINHKSYLKKKNVFQFLRLIHHSKKREFKVTEGTYGKKIHFNGESIKGTTIYLNNQVVHCTAFIKDFLAYGPEKEYNVA